MCNYNCEERAALLRDTRQALRDADTARTAQNAKAFVASAKKDIQKLMSAAKRGVFG
jgi:hypothetical protein